MNNLIFLSGPQGAGKTTLESLFLEDSRFLIPDIKTKTISLDTNPLDRLALKICQRSLENFEYLEIAKKNKDKFVIGNRCIYDQLAFNNVYLSMGWIENADLSKYNAASMMFYCRELKKPRAIVLNPGFEIVMKHLKKRWEIKEKKWREENIDYIKCACESYEIYKNNDKILYLDYEIDLNSGKDRDLIIGWAHSKEGILV